jgi:hypothetical protein
MQQPSSLKSKQQYTVYNDDYWALSLVLPRYSTFLGREDDDWQIDASRPLLEDPAR